MRQSAAAAAAAASSSSSSSSSSSTLTPTEDLTIEDLPISQVEVAELAALIEGGRISPAAAPVLVDKLMERDLGESSSSSSSSSTTSFTLNELINYQDLWVNKDSDWIRSLVLEKLIGAPQAKEVVKDNPKKNARAKMELIGKTIELSEWKADPMVVKSVVEEEIEKLRRAKKGS